jgi:hypothetical protein
MGVARPFAMRLRPIAESSPSGIFISCVQFETANSDRVRSRRRIGSGQFGR